MFKVLLFKTCLAVTLQVKDEERNRSDLMHIADTVEVLLKSIIQHIKRKEDGVCVNLSEVLIDLVAGILRVMSNFLVTSESIERLDGIRVP